LCFALEHTKPKPCRLQLLKGGGSSWQHLVHGDLTSAGGSALSELLQVQFPAPLSHISLFGFLTATKVQVSREVSWCPRRLRHGSREQCRAVGPGVERECTSVARKRARARRLRSRPSSALASELQSNCSPKAPGGVSSSEIRCADVGKRALEAACFRQDADGRGRDKGLADARTTMNHLLPSSLVPLMLYVCM